MTLANYEKEKSYYRSATNFIMVLLITSMDYIATLVHPNYSINNGTAGCLILYFVIFIFFGIPLLYMELTVSQYTARDCLDVWKARKCVSHIGYIQVAWQIFALIHNHVMVAMIIHYFLISFANPIPYTQCGPWSTPDCEISKNNLTVASICLRQKESFSFCDNLHQTYPEYQYWRYYFLRGSQARKNDFQIASKAILASALVCAVVYLHCFKRFQSIKYFLRLMVTFPFLVYILFFLGSMLQKGIVTHYSVVLDTDFSVFLNSVKVSSTLQHVIFSLGIGSGTIFNLSSRTSFRSSCYSTTVITAMLAAAFTLLTVSTTSMMSCPYAFEYGMKTHTIQSSNLHMAFEKLPIIISQLDNPVPYLILLYSCLGCIGISTDVMYFFNLSEIILKRYKNLAKYPILVNLIGIFILFLVSLPAMGSFGINYIQSMYKYQLNLLLSFICITECVVFVFWYGFDRFSEDIHFMQGAQPRTFLKIGWAVSIIVYAYVFCSEIQVYSPFTNKGTAWGFYILMLSVGIIVFIFIGRIFVAICRGKFREEVQLDSTWGPKSDVLQRSRAMFTAQAMTKEYLYRQYHLQAGIVARQRRSNVHFSPDHFERPFSVV